MNRLIVTNAKKVSQMIGSIEKRMKKRFLSPVPKDIYEGLNLKELPSYVSFRATSVREKLLLQHALLFTAFILALYFAFSRAEIAGLETKLREKEYILAPGVQDFTPASPGRVGDRYILAAAQDFLHLLGSVNPVNIDEQYKNLSQSMSANLRVQFLAEAAPWVDRVKRENISEIVTVQKKKVESDNSGTYRVVASAKCDTYSGAEYLGYRNEVIEFDLKLVPPKEEKRWFLEINRLLRSSEDSYMSRKKIAATEGRNHE